MAVTTEISWGDGTSDKIYLTRNASEGNQTVLVSSDANTGAARSKVVTFSASGVTPVTLTVSQAAGSVQPVFYDKLQFAGGAYIDTGLQIPANGSIYARFGGETSKSQQRLYMTKSDGSGFFIGAFLTSATTTTNRYFGAYYDSSSNLGGNNKTLRWTYDAYIFFQTPKRFGLAATSWTYTKGSTHPTGTLVLGENLYSSTRVPYTGFMRDFLIYGSDAQDCTSYDQFANYTPVYTLRPCTYNGEAGMWIVETNTFKGNAAGTGSLTASNI